MVKVGIIGCGKIAQVRHIPEYLDNPNAKLTGLYDLNQQRAKDLAEKYGCRSYESIEDMLADPEIDAVSVCAANHVHAEITIAALKAGKHVLCEKPMATKLKDCQMMVDTAEQMGKKLMIGQNQRFAKAHVEARKLIQRGDIGNVLTFKTTFGHGGPETWSIDAGPQNWFFDKKRAAMGAMADLGVHKTDLIQYLLNDTVEETTAKVMTLDKKDSNGNLIGVDDNAICIYKMKSGIIGTMTASWTYYGDVYKRQEEGAPVRLMNMMRIGSAVRQGVRYSIRLIAAALMAVLAAVYISYCSKARRMERSYCTDRRSVIIQYIQHQDGSKG